MGTTSSRRPGSCFTPTGTDIGGDPQLDPLGPNGGPTDTHALQSTSPALDAGGATGPAKDQRGFDRPAGPAFDIGAFERQLGADLSITKTDSADPVAVGGKLSYDIRVANAGPSTGNRRGHHRSAAA